jgi:hypothetical protein
MKHYYLRGETIVCHDCGATKPKFIAREIKRREYVDICELCAEKLPDIYVVHATDDGSCQLLTDGTLEDAKRTLERALVQSGYQEVRDYNLLRIPGKWVFGSTYDHCKHGIRVPFQCHVTGKVLL